MVFQNMDTLSPHARNLVDFIREQMAQESDEDKLAARARKTA